MRGTSPPVGDRENLARGEQPKAGQRDRHPHRDAYQHVGRRQHPQIQVGDGHEQHHCGRRPLAALPPAAFGHQRIQDPQQGDNQRGHLLRRQRPRVPPGAEDHPERPGPLRQRRRDVLDNHTLHDPSGQHDEQLTQAPEDQ